MEKYDLNKVTPGFRQYFGPNTHFPGPAVEISFPAVPYRYRIKALISHLLAIGSEIGAYEGEETVGLAEAIGILSSILHTRWGTPDWNYGTTDSTSWVCLAHIYPQISISLLLAVFRTLAEYPAASEETIRNLLFQARRINSIDNVTILLNRVARNQRVSFTPVSIHTNTNQLGQGKRGLHCFGLATELDSLSGLHLSIDKLGTVEFLQRMGLPTTRAAIAYNPEQAQHVARQLGYPCVIKPINLGKGKGITTNIRNARQIDSAVRYAHSAGGFPIMVEGQIDGFDHRMLVVNGKLLSAYRRTPPHVFGDGITPIRQLIDAENRRRMEQKGSTDRYLKPILVDQALHDFLDGQNGLSLDTIPDARQCIYLRGQANLAQGGTLSNLTRNVHPDNHELAIQVARLFRVHAIGIDFMTSDIAVSWKDSPCAIIEVNCTPGLSGIGDATLALRTLLPKRLSGRIPTFLVVAPRSEGNVLCRSIANILEANSLIATLHLPDATAPGQTQGPPSLGWRVERSVLDPATTALVIQISASELLRNGAPIGNCDAIFWPHAEHLPPSLDETIEDILRCFTDTKRIDHPLTHDELVAQIDEVLTEFASEPDNIHPTIELLPTIAQRAGNDADNAIRQVRFWRIPAIPMHWISKQLQQEDTKVADGMLDNYRLAEIFATLSNERLSTAEKLTLAPMQEGASWDTPFFIRELNPAITRGSAAEAAASFAATHLNGLIGKYFSTPQKS